MLKIAQLRYPFNQSKLGNVYKAEGRLYEVSNMMLMNESLIHHKHVLLTQLMNLPSEFDFSIDTTFSLNSFLPNEADTALLAESRSDIRRMDKTIQSLMLNQVLERVQSKPDFNLSFNHMIPRGAGMPSQFMLLGMISIPIAPWSAKMYKSRVKGIDLEIEAMKNDRQSILRELQAKTNEMSNEIKSLSKQIENYEKRILPALRKNYETLMLAYEENKEELPIVIDAWETLNMTQMQYLDTVQKYYEMKVSYEKQIEQ
jgi:outer membrane protein TolC